MWLAGQLLFKGTVFEVVDQAVDFVLSKINLAVGTRAEGNQAPVAYEMPPEVVREAIVNAVAHRDYTISAPIRIFIFDDRVEVRTPGSLPNTVTIDAIRLGAVHVLRNPILYTLFSRLGLVTGIGTGIYRTIQQVRKFAKKDPLIFFEGNEFIISLPRIRSNEEQ